MFTKICQEKFSFLIFLKFFGKRKELEEIRVDILKENPKLH